MEYKWWDDLWRRFSSPPLFIFVLLSILSITSLAFIFYFGFQDRAISIVFYVLSAYTLFLWIMNGIKIGKKGRLYLNKFNIVNRYSSDISFKAEVSLYVTLAINLLFSFYQAFSGFYYHSAWFGTFAFYYMILTIERFSLLRYIRKENHLEMDIYKKYRFCGLLLIVLNIAVCGMSILMITDGNASIYPGHMIYAVAGFTFYTLIMAIVNVRRYHRRSSLIYGASKMITLSTALFSMFSLQNAMISVFGSDMQFKRIMNIITGAVVFAILSGISIYMIYKGSYEIHLANQRQSL